MRVNRRKTHLTTVICGLLIWLVAGIGLPFLLGTITDGLSIDNSSVIASPGNSFQITDPVVLSYKPLVVVERGTIVLVDGAGKQATGPGALGVLKSGRGSLLLSGGAVRIAGSHREATTEVEGAGDSEVDPIVSALAGINFQSLRLVNTAIAMTLSDRAELVAKNADAKLDIGRGGVLTGGGKGLIRGVPVTFDLRSAPQAKLEPDKTNGFTLSFRLKSGIINVEFDGQLRGVAGIEMRGRGRVQSTDLRGTVAWLTGGSSEGTGLKRFEIAGDLDWSQQAVAFDKAAIKLDDNEATGALVLNLAGGRPAITGTLALNTLNLTQYLAGDLGDQRRGFDLSSLYAMPFQMPLGKQIDADVRLSASKVVAADLKFERSAATVALKSGRLLADIAQFELAGGQGSGQLGADFRGFWPSFTFRGKIANVDFAKTSLAPVAQKLQGETGITANLTGHGGSLTEVVRSISGTVGVKSEKGGRLGLDFKALMSAARQEPLKGWSHAKGGTTAFDTLNAELVAKNGTIFAKQLEAVAGRTMWSGKGSLSFVTGDVDILVEQGVAPVATPSGTSSAGKPVDGQDLLKLEIKGPMEAPSITSVMTKPGRAIPEPAKQDRTELTPRQNGSQPGKG
ncbi:MAG: hypothetical protein RLZ98_227 [Pseudomonadota bacterium]|jgi:hypothetical protein